MKKLEFKTSKGSFMLVDSVEIEGIKLSEITEQQASEIVDKKPSFIDDEGNVILNYRNYLYHNIQAPHIWKQSAIHSLQSLLKSKGVYLYENPHNTVEAEQQTFYNPVIFKL